MKERLQKIIAAKGVFSRRAVERLIEERKIRVNDKVITVQGLKVDPFVDKIVIDGKLFVADAEPVTMAVLFNKPRHVMVTRSDPEGRRTVYDFLPTDLKPFKPVGRLDYNSQGALILTNDGDLILGLTHPRYHLDKVYEVKLSSHPDERQLIRLRQGVVMDGERTMPAKIDIVKKSVSSTLVRITLTEGKNRQIRRMCEAVGLTVKELRRISIGPIKLGSLRSGKHRFLSVNEIRLLLKHVSQST